MNISPCAFCGGVGKLFCREQGFRAMLSVVCSQCDAQSKVIRYHITENDLVGDDGESCDGGKPSPPESRKTQAIAAWNTRAIPPAFLEAVAGCVEALQASESVIRAVIVEREAHGRDTGALEFALYGIANKGGIRPALAKLTAALQP